MTHFDEMKRAREGRAAQVKRIEEIGTAIALVVLFVIAFFAVGWICQHPFCHPATIDGKPVTVCEPLRIYYLP